MWKFSVWWRPFKEFLNIFASSKNYECNDFNKQCQVFAKNDPTACTSPKHPSFNFMKMGCMKTCNQCGTKVKNQFKDFVSYTSTPSLSLYQLSHKKVYVWKLKKGYSFKFWCFKYHILNSIEFSWMQLNLTF